jgi:very-short-patch-repair endonuclease
MSKRDPKEALHDYLAYTPASLGLVTILVTEYRFHPTRKWRFDYAWPNLRIAIEFDGIMHRTVGHNSLAGILRDSEKINEAQRLGWRVFRANAKNVGDGTFFALIESVLAQEATAA